MRQESKELVARVTAVRGHVGCGMWGRIRYQMDDTVPCQLLEGDFDPKKVGELMKARRDKDEALCIGRRAGSTAACRRIEVTDDPEEKKRRCPKKLQKQNK